MVNLQEYIYPEMDVLFLALNAPEVSNANAHWFSRNLSFWNVLYSSGLITQEIIIPTAGDIKVFKNNDINYKKWIYGVTDLNNEIVETNSNKVTIEQKHIQRIIEILKNNKVNKLCLLHSAVGSAIRDAKILQKRSNNRYGFIGYLNETAVYEVPFHNAPIANKDQYYRTLIDNDLVEEVEKPKLISTIHVKQNVGINKDMVTEQFIIPSVGNSITEADLYKGTLRITADFKDRFPNRDTYITLKYGTMSKNVSYQIKPGKSSLLKIGKDIVEELRLLPNCHIRFEKIGSAFCYRVSREK